MFDIEIVKAGKRGLRPGVVAIEYIDWLLGLLYFVLPIWNPYLSTAGEGSGVAVFDIVGDPGGTHDNQEIRCTPRNSPFRRNTQFNTLVQTHCECLIRTKSLKDIRK